MPGLILSKVYSMVLEASRRLFLSYWTPSEFPRESLDQYGVPREDLPTITERALGGRNEIHGDVVAFLEGLYSSP
jgi:hypothetical protein